MSKESNEALVWEWVNPNPQTQGSAWFELCCDVWVLIIQVTQLYADTLPNLELPIHEVYMWVKFLIKEWSHSLMLKPKDLVYAAMHRTYNQSSNILYIYLALNSVYACTYYNYSKFWVTLGFSISSHVHRQTVQCNIMFNHNNGVHSIARYTTYLCYYSIPVMRM